MNGITKSLEDYLEAIYLINMDGQTACVNDIAKLLHVKMPSVVKGVHELKKLEMVTQAPYSPVELTAKGRRAAALVLKRHTMIKDFLVKIGVSKSTADRDACLMEHILSPETLEKIKAYNSAEG